MLTCPTCGVWTTGGVVTCPGCGGALGGAADGPARAGVLEELIVEGSAERGPIRAELPLPDEEQMEAGRPETGVVAARPSLPALLWRRPEVRTLATAGAGAVALSLGMRLMRAWLGTGRMGRQVAPRALPLVTDLLESTGESTRRGNGRASRQAGGTERGTTEVVETLIVMRRVVRGR